MTERELAAELRRIAEKLQKASCAIDMYTAAAQLKWLAGELDRKTLALAHPDAGHRLGDQN